jgi:hypothetical protein
MTVRAHYFASHELLQPLLILAGARNGRNQLRAP